jgi:hypothetical protein
LDKEFEGLYDDLHELDRFAVIVRYPGIIIDAKTAEEALKEAGRVRKFISKKLKIK